MNLKDNLEVLEKILKSTNDGATKVDKEENENIIVVFYKYNLLVV